MENGFFSTKGNRILGAVALVMAILALASWTILNLSLLSVVLCIAMSYIHSQ